MLCALAGALAATPDATAQTLRGTVLDRHSGLPVLVASALLLNEHGIVRRAAITDSVGVFQLDLPQAGFYGLRVDMPGYEPLIVPPFDVGPDEVVEFVVLADYTDSRIDRASVRRYTRRRPQLDPPRRL